MSIKKLIPLFISMLISFQGIASEIYTFSNRDCLSQKTILPIRKNENNSQFNDASIKEKVSDIVNDVRKKIKDFNHFIFNKPLKLLMKSCMFLLIFFSPSLLFAQVTEQSLIRSYLNYSNQTDINKLEVENDLAKIELAKKNLLPLIEFSLTPSLSTPISQSETGVASVDNNKFIVNGGVNFCMPSLGGFASLDVQRNRKGETTVSLTYQQEILRGGPFSGMSESEYNLADTKARGEQNSISSSIDMVNKISELRMLFWQLFVYDSMIKESSIRLSEFKRSLDFERKRDSLGVGSRDEVLRAELLKTQFERYIENLKGELASLQQKISAITGVPAEQCKIADDFQAAVNSKPNSSIIIDSLDQSLKIRFSELNISRSVLLEEFNKNDALSSLSIGPSIGMTDGSFSGTGQQFFAGATLTFTPNWGAKSKNKIASTQTRIAQLENQELKKEMIAEVNSLYEKLSSLTEQYRLMQEELRLASERYSNVADEYYKTGRYQTAKEVLESLFSLIEKQREAIEMIYKIKTVEIQLDNISGYIKTRLPFISNYLISGQSA